MTSADLVNVLKKHPIGVGSLLVIITCGSLLYWRSGDITASQQDLQSSTAQADKMTANVRNANGLAEQVSELQSRSKEIESRLMKASQLADNLQYFYKLETENEIKLVDVRQNALPRNSKTQFTGVPFTLSIRGTYVQVMNFLNRLNNGRHFCRINTANLAKVEGTKTDVTLTLNLDLLGQP